MTGTSGHGRDEWPKLDADPAPDATPTPETGAGAAKDMAGGKTGEREELATQFQELGQRLVATARAAWQSEQRQDLQQEITDGLRTVRDQLSEAVDTVRSSPRTQQTTETVRGVVGKANETVRANELFDDLRTGLASGLRELNEQLRRVAERLEKGDNATATTDAPAPASTATTMAATPGATTPAETAPEVDQLLGDPGLGTAPSVEIKGDLPTKPEGPAGVEKV